MADAIRIHDEKASVYERQRRRLVPPYDAFYGAAVEALRLARRPLEHVLDLGAGTGLLARQVIAAHPGARLTLLDGAPAMLEQARTTVGDHVTLRVGDLRDPLPDGPWDAIVSALAVHHLDDADKRELFARVHAELAPGGMFVNAEQVAGPTALFDDRYETWHEDHARRAGTTDEEWSATQQRMQVDRRASVERQLEWLREAGFADSDCLFKDHGFAVLVARRAG